MQTSMKKRIRKENYTWRTYNMKLKKLYILFSLWVILSGNKITGMNTPYNPNNYQLIDNPDTEKITIFKNQLHVNTPNENKQGSTTTNKKVLVVLKKHTKKARVIFWFVSPCETLFGFSFDDACTYIVAKTNTNKSNKRPLQILLNQKNTKIVNWSLKENIIALQFQDGTCKLFELQPTPPSAGNQTQHCPKEIFSYNIKGNITDFCISANKTLIAIVANKSIYFFENNISIGTLKPKTKPDRLIIQNDKTVLIGNKDIGQIIYDIQNKQTIYSTDYQKLILSWNKKPSNHLLLYFPHNKTRILEIKNKIYKKLLSQTFKKPFSYWHITPNKQFILFFFTNSSLQIHDLNTKNIFIIPPKTSSLTTYNIQGNYLMAYFANKEVTLFQTQSSKAIFTTKIKDPIERWMINSQNSSKLEFVLFFFKNKPAKCFNIKTAKEININKKNKPLPISTKQNQKSVSSNTPSKKAQKTPILPTHKESSIIEKNITGQKRPRTALVVDTVPTYDQHTPPNALHNRHTNNYEKKKKKRKLQLKDSK